MGLITSALQIGKSALMAYQAALQVVGNNISNAGSASYARQTAILNPSMGVPLPEGFTPGGGVALSALKRNIDDALENRIRRSIGDQYDALNQQQALGRIEAVLNELSDTDISSALQGFFNAFSALQNTPHDNGARGIVLTAGDTLVREIQRQRTDTLLLRDELNGDIEDAAGKADDLARQIATLNSQIVDVESATHGDAGALRDQRDLLLRELSEFVQVEVREQPNGSVNVYLGNEPLIQDGIYRGLVATLDVTNGEPRMTARFADTQAPVSLTGGKLAGLVAARDEHVMGHVQELDKLAATLIREVNKVHAQGRGLVGMSVVNGSYDVLDPNAALNSTNAGLDAPPRNGSFQITVRDKAGGAETVATITVDLDGVGADDSLNSLVAQINAKVGNVTAVTTSDNRLQITAGDGYEITFGQDSSNVLAGLGVNSFFTGAGAQDIAVNPALVANSRLIAAGRSASEGDGTNAAALAALAGLSLDSLNGQNLIEYYNTLATTVAVKSASAKAGVDAADVIASTLTAQRESISGVSLDEETIAMLRLERAFQGSARFTSTVDGLIQEMLQLVG